MTGKTPPPCVIKSARYSQSVIDVAPDQISDAIARLVSSLIARVVHQRTRVDWTTLTVTTKKSPQKDLWETTVSVEEA